MHLQILLAHTATTKTVDFVETTTGTPTANANTFIKTIDGLSVKEIGANIVITSANGVNHNTGTFPALTTMHTLI